MSFDPGLLDATLAAAVGDDQSLKAELRQAFLDGVQRQALSLACASGEPEWRTAAWRLKGLAASFGATELMMLADSAVAAKARDPGTLRELADALAAFG